MKGQGRAIDAAMRAVNDSDLADATTTFFQVSGTG